MSSTALGPIVWSKRKSCSLSAKRALDLFGACACILMLAPTFLLIALLIKLHDRGPVFHRRRMIGMDGEFFLFKFRSMCMNADTVLQNDPALMAEFQKNYKLEKDPRVTPLGRFLRKWSLDELPQLLNVLRGEMSLVGPRSITREELVKYGEWTQLVHSVRPGLSGYWQTEGRSKVTYDERVQMDVRYVQNWSLLWDLKILLKTPVVVLKGDGAY